MKKIIVSTLFAFALFHVVTFLLFTIAAGLFDFPTSVGFPLKIYTISCGLAFDRTACETHVFYTQNIIINLGIWLLVGLVVFCIKRLVRK